MLYFENTKLAQEHHVSLMTVHNWIKAAKQGKLNLTLHTEGNSVRIKNTAANTELIKQLVAERRKFRNSRGVKTISPRGEFYKIYNQEEAYNIANSLDVYREIPREYNYFGEGASNWDRYAQRMAGEATANNLKNSIFLIAQNQDYLDKQLSPYSKINVIDLGPGNGLPVRPLLTHLLDQNKLGRYIGVDISETMLEIVQRNIKEWFGDQVKFEGHKKDINYDRFTDITDEAYLKDDPQDTANLILLLGSTTNNFRSPDMALHIIHDSLGPRDLFIHNQKLDTENSRRFFDFSADPEESTLSPNHRLLLELLGIESNLYEAEAGFNDDLRQRYIRIRLKVALTISFTLEKGTRTINFNKNDRILLWRSWHHSTLDILHRLDKADFRPFQISHTNDQEYIVIISRIKSPQSEAS